MSTDIDVSGAERNPYVGPQAFRRGESLYGRDNETADLLDLLIAERVVLLHSPSGAGKSSLIAAGLIPRLEDEGFEVLPVVRVNHEIPPDGLEGRPHNRYSLSTLLSLEEGLPREHLHGMEQLDKMTVTQYLALWPDLDHQPGNEVLIFDQFEEVITADPNDHDAKAAYFADIGTALRDRNIWALFSIREDFLAELDPYARLVPTRFANRFGLDLLTVDQALEAMTRPAADRGVEFTDAAARKLVDDLRRIRVKRPGGITEELGSTVEPVQLQVACRQLWSRRDGRTAIELPDVEAVGNVDQALATYYADCVRRTAAETGVSEREVRDWLERELVTPQGIRNQVLQGPRAEGAAGERVVALLTAAHLVRAESRRGATWYELAHDRLIEPVKEDNARWREEHLALFQQRAIRWDAEGRPDHSLLSSHDLAEAKRWVAENPGALSMVEQEFLEASRRAVAEAERERRANRRTRQWLLVSVVVGVLAIIAATVAWLAQQRAERLASASEVSALAGVAGSAVNFDVDLGLLLAQEAARLPGASLTDPAIRDALQLAVSRSPVVDVFRGHGPATGAQYSPDGSVVVTQHDDGSVVVWEASSHDELYTLSAPEGGLQNKTVTFSPDGTRVAAVTTTGEVAIWSATPDAGEPTVISPHDGFSSWRIAFSPDGSRIAALGTWGIAVVDEAGDPDAGFDSEASADLFGTDIEWTSDGERLVVGDINGVVSAWDAESGQHVGDIATHPTAVLEVDVSSSGLGVASTSENMLLVSDIDGGTSLHQLDRFGLADISFNSDGSRAVAIDKFGTAVVVDPTLDNPLLWVLANGTSPVSVDLDPTDPGRALVATGTGSPAIWDVAAAYTDYEAAVEALPDGGVVTASYDGTVHVWSADRAATTLGENFLPPGRAGTAEPEETAFGAASSGDAINDASASRDGDRVALVRSTGAVEVWDVTDQDEVAVLAMETETAQTVALSPDGRSVAAGGSFGTIHVWDVNTGQELHRLESHTDAVTSLDYGADSTQLVTGSRDKTAIIWSVGDRLPEHVERLDAEVTAVAWNAPGTRVAVADADGSVRFWDVNSAAMLTEPAGHARSVNDIAFDATGDRLVSGSGDQLVIVWDAATGTISNVVRHGREPWRVAFASDGEHIVVGDGTLVPRVVYLDGSELLRLATQKTTRELTPRECRLYLGEDANCPEE